MVMAMKIGILICDNVRPELEAEHGNYKQMFRKLLHSIDDTLDLRFYWVNHREFPQDINECDAYITSGSKSSVLDSEQWIDEVEQLVYQIFHAGIPFIGICFGHQMLAKALGGKVAKAQVGWGVGAATTPILAHQAWMTPGQSSVNLLVSHQDQVLSLPPEGKVLAGNDFCPISIMQVGAKALGIQAHPEFCAPYSKALIDVRKDTIPLAVQTKGVTSLKLPTDGLLVTQWMLNFINQAKQTP